MPLRVWNDETAMTTINKDRAANAKRLGESCKQLKPPKAEDINMLDETYEQWPFPTECPTCPDDVPKEAAAGTASTVPKTLEIHGMLLCKRKRLGRAFRRSAVVRAHLGRGSQQRTQS